MVLSEDKIEMIKVQPCLECGFERVVIDIFINIERVERVQCE